MYVYMHVDSDILVGTPGRLTDIFENVRDVAASLNNVQTLIFDEADQLLDMGFRPSIERILSLLSASKATRQTLLFSATAPSDVQQISKIALKP